MKSQTKTMNGFANSLLLALVLAGTLTAVAADTSRVYVRFKPGQKSAARAVVEQAGGRVHHEFDKLDAVATTLPATVLAGVRNHPLVERVEDDPPRYLSGCDLPLELVPYGLNAVRATALWDGDGDGVIDPGAPTGAGIRIGVIDSGVLTAHPDFAGVPMTGYADPGYDWRSDTLGHGTHVTGTIVAQLNGSGVVGVSPGVSIHMVKVFEYFDDPDPFVAGGYWIYSSTLLDAAQRCQAAGARIINMSLGGPAASQTEADGFAQLYHDGLLLVASAGNAGDASISYPAGYGAVISVAAVDENLAVAGFSQRNSDVELAAPGVNVLSTVSYCADYSVTGSGFSYPGNPIDQAMPGTATGILVDGGLGQTMDAAWAGKIVLVQRGAISFSEKVMNVQNSGGLACIIYNNVTGGFFGSLFDGPSAIPAIGISLEDGQALRARFGESTTVNTRVLRDVSAWDYLSGTSMSAPHVCAVAALLWSTDPARSNAEIRQRLAATALDLGSVGRDDATGYGLVQAKAGATPPGDTIAPVISNVRASVVDAKRGTFRITWTTDEPATSVIILNGTPYTDTTLVTSHSRTFPGRKRTTYTYSVRSADAAGNEVTAGPFTYRN